jgi:hypothetical protein
VVAVALTGSGVQAGICSLPRTGQYRHRMGINDTGEFLPHHLVQMAQEAEPGHIRGGVHLVPARDLCRCFVQGGHGTDCGFHLFRSGFAHPVGGADQPHAKRLGQKKFVARAAGIVGRQAVRVYQACHRQAVLHTGIGNGVPTHQHAPGFGHLFGTAAQDLPQHVQVHALGEADKIQCRFDLTAHGVDIAQGIGRSDLPEGIGVIDHRREEIHRLHQGNILGNAVDGSIVPAVVANQKVGVFFAPGQLFQNAAQYPGTQLGGASAAGAEDNGALSCHFMHAPFHQNKSTRPAPHIFCAGARGSVLRQQCGRGHPPD